MGDGFISAQVNNSLGNIIYISIIIYGKNSKSLYSKYNRLTYKNYYYEQMYSVDKSYFSNQ